MKNCEKKKKGKFVSRLVRRMEKVQVYDQVEKPEMVACPGITKEEIEGDVSEEKLAWS